MVWFNFQSSIKKTTVSASASLSVFDKAHQHWTTTAIQSMRQRHCAPSDLQLGEHADQKTCSKAHMLPRITAGPQQKSGLSQSFLQEVRPAMASVCQQQQQPLTCPWCCAEVCFTLALPVLSFRYLHKTLMGRQYDKVINQFPRACACLVLHLVDIMSDRPVIMMLPFLSAFDKLNTRDCMVTVRVGTGIFGNISRIHCLFSLPHERMHCSPICITCLDSLHEGAVAASNNPKFGL